LDCEYVELVTVDVTRGEAVESWAYPRVRRLPIAVRMERREGMVRSKSDFRCNVGAFGAMGWSYIVVVKHREPDLDHTRDEENIASADDDKDNIDS
jgi:hypothetical protein